MSTVAVCEDDAALRSVLTRSMRSAGHEVVLARNGSQALLTFPPATPDVVILEHLHRRRRRASLRARAGGGVDQHRRHSHQRQARRRHGCSFADHDDPVRRAAGRDIRRVVRQ